LGKEGVGVMLDLIIVLAPILCGVLIWSAARDQAQVPTKPPNSPIVHKTQAVRKSALYGNPDVNQRPLEKEEAA
jgi:hypothetical protein